MSCCPTAIISSTFFQKSNECLHSKWFIVALLVSSVAFFSLAALGGVGFFAPGNIFSQGIIGAIGHNGCLAVLIGGATVGGLEVISSLILLTKNKGKELLKKAAEQGNAEKLPKFAANKIKVYEGPIEENETALHRAVRCGQYISVKNILESRGIDINAQTKNGWTALHYAIMYDFDLEYLIKQGDFDFDVQDDNGDTPLHLAVRKLDSAAVEKLIDNSDITIKNKDGKKAQDCIPESDAYESEKTADFCNIARLLRNKESEVWEKEDLEINSD